MISSEADCNSSRCREAKFSWLPFSGHDKVIEEGSEGRRRVLFVIVVATVLLGMAVILMGSTIAVYLQVALAQPSRVQEIRCLRQTGLQTHQEEG